LTKWSYDALRGLRQKEFRRITGVSQGNFEALYSFLGGDEVCGRLKYKYSRGTPKALKSSLKPRDRLLMTLLRLRRGFSIEDLALFFEVSISTVSTVFYVWAQFLYRQFKKIQREMFTSRHDQKKKEFLLVFDILKTSAQFLTQRM